MPPCTTPVGSRTLCKWACPRNLRSIAARGDDVYPVGIARKSFEFCARRHAGEKPAPGADAA